MPKYYLLDENKNLVEGFDKEGFLAILQQAIEQGSLENIDEDSAVASKLRSVLNGTAHHIEFVTQAQYNELESEGELVENTYYFIIDDPSFENFEREFEEETNSLNENLDEVTERINSIVNGQTPVGKATKLSGEFVRVAMSSVPTLSLGKTYMIYWENGLNYDVINFGVVYADPKAKASCSLNNGQTYYLEIYNSGIVAVLLGTNNVDYGYLHYKEIL